MAEWTVALRAFAAGCFQAEGTSRGAQAKKCSVNVGGAQPPAGRPAGEASAPQKIFWKKKISPFLARRGQKKRPSGARRGPPGVASGGVAATRAFFCHVRICRGCPRRQHHSSGKLNWYCDNYAHELTDGEIILTLMPSANHFIFWELFL
jgi:hypothetical protein